MTAKTATRTLGRNDLLALSGVQLAKYANYHRRGQLPFSGNARGERTRFRAHHVLLVSALSDLARDNGVDNELAARVIKGAFAVARCGEGDLWLGMADGRDGAPPAFAGGDVLHVAQRLSASDGVDRMLTWNLSASWREVARRADELGLPFPELREILAEGQRMEADASGPLEGTEGLGRFQAAALSSISDAAAQAARRGFSPAAFSSLRDHPPVAKALAGIGGQCRTADAAAAVLTETADEIVAALGRPGTDEWVNGSLVAGWLRTAAAEVWSVR